MKTDLNELKKFYENTFTGELYENIKVTVNTREKKPSTAASINIKMQINEKKTVIGTVYIVEKEKTTYVLFVNDKTHDIIFSNLYPDSVEKSKRYVVNYFERSIKRALGDVLSDDVDNN